MARNYFRFSAMMPVGKHEFHVNFGTTNVRLDADLDDDGAKQWTLGYNYNITKETKVYGFYTRVDNDIVACHRRAPQLLKGATSSANFLPSQAAGYDISFKTEPREIP